MEKIHMAISLINKLKLKFTPKERHILVVLDGVYKGEWLVEVSKTNDHTVFLSLPDKYERIIPNKDIVWGIENKVIDIVGALPKKVYNVCVAEYHYAKQHNSFNRREQHSAPRPLDRKKYKQSLVELQRAGDRLPLRVFKNDKI